MSDYYIILNDSTRKSIFCIKGQDPLFLNESFFAKMTELSNLVRENPQAANNKEINRLINTAYTFLKSILETMKELKDQ